ncbi:hypothetical protein [Cohnella sp. OV330]|uniref:hypothetical protein n=1 Tax=Cohnella sp. OV330 TaxID=1855288 RepID=UPI0015A4F9E3|nr:hypothetical protein [Cohnella sp. OV330]
MRLSDPENEAVACAIAGFLEKRGAPKQSNPDTILLRESAVADFYDFLSRSYEPVGNGLPRERRRLEADERLA